MKRKPKVVFFDLETMHNPRIMTKHIPTIANWDGRTWRAELGVIISFGYQIEGGPVKCINAWDFPMWEIDRFNDSTMVEAIFEILYDADEIVTHNGKKYDVKYFNTRAAKHGIPGIKSGARGPKHVDTKQICSANYTLYSNSLEGACNFFDLPFKKMKIHNKWSLWERFMWFEESKKDMKLMSDYCKSDIDALRELYYKTREHHGAKTLNKTLWNDGDENICETCGSDDLIGHGVIPRKKGLTQRWLCKSCGSTKNTPVKKAKLKAVV